MLPLMSASLWISSHCTGDLRKQCLVCCCLSRCYVGSRHFGSYSRDWEQRETMTIARDLLGTKFLGAKRADLLRNAVIDIRIL
jgi:hypothetical protein